MRIRALLVSVFGSSLAGCCGSGPVTVREASPIKSACTAGSKAPASVGLDVRPGRRHSDARTLSVTNVGDRPRTVRVDDVSRLEGPCAGEWARSTTLSFSDALTAKAPEPVTLAPGEHIEVDIGPQHVASAWECSKLGIALWAAVDGERVCADAGAWIATREGTRDDD
jgi:hypothetical protein